MTERERFIIESERVGGREGERERKNRTERVGDIAEIDAFLSTGVQV